MKQTKKKSQKSENKQPINVQLSKQDLMELLTVVKDFTSEEISTRNKRIFLNQSEMCKRILNLEIGQACLRSEIRALKTPPTLQRVSVCPHKYVFKSAQYHKKSFRLSTITYKCKNCGMEWLKLPCFLTRKEKKALRILGVITK